MLPRIGILVLGAANRRSIACGLQRAGAAVELVTAARGIAHFDALVVPGVAHVGYLVDAVDRYALRAPLLRAIEKGVPVLGICAGFQMFFDASEEAPQARGLGVFRGFVTRIEAAKTPHMGWNSIEPTRGSDLEPGWAYFAHSYAVPQGVRDAVALTKYQTTFVSVAKCDNVLGVQFHPERSGSYGADLLKDFVRAC